MTWTPDNKGFFYQRYDAPKKETLLTRGTGTEKLVFPKIFYHRVGTSQE